MMNLAGGFAFILIILCIGAYEEIKSRNLIKEWAQKNEFKIISINRKRTNLWNFRKLPFPYDRRSPIFYVAIEDAGISKSAYIKCGNVWFGILGKGFEVKWIKSTIPTETK